MKPTIHRMPIFVMHRGRLVPCRGGAVGALVRNPARPTIASIADSRFGVDVTLDGLAAGMDGEWVEPFGDVTLNPVQDGPRTWLQIHLDGKLAADVDLWIDANEVSAFLGDVALEEVLHGGRQATAGGDR